VNLCRLLLSVTLIFSGFVKAIDPLGTQYKIQDYLGALSLGSLLPDWLTLALSVMLAAIEFILGILLLFAIHRRVTSRLILALMVVMTLVTLWIWIADPVSDCGCFGDAIVLTNGQTLLKNIVLLFAAVVVCLWPLHMMRFISKGNQWIVVNYTLLFIIAVSVYCLYDLPIFDFRPYHVGADLRKGMEIPEGEAQPEFETTFILEKDGERREFTLENYPDSTWTFIDSKSVMTREGYIPPIHDFMIEDVESGDDLTDVILSDEGYNFLLISPYLEHANDSNFGSIDQIYEYCQDNDYGFYCLTSSGSDAIQRWCDLTGAEYPFCHTDGVTLKTIIRSNPGLLLLHDGKVVRKWSHNYLPDASMLTDRLEKLEIGSMPTDSVARKLFRIFIWFALPLLVLTFADRLWAWTRWVRRRK
jgi:triosephosphate isomerase